MDRRPAARLRWLGGEMLRARREARLDPVRSWWPGRGVLVRAALIAVLLAAAGTVLRSPVTSCAPGSVAAPATPVSSGSGETAPADDALRGSDRAATAGRAPALPPDTVGVPIRLSDGVTSALIHAGDQVDLLRLDTRGPTRLADGVVVVRVTDDPTAERGLVVALPAAQAAAVIGASERTRYAVLLR